MKYDHSNVVLKWRMFKERDGDVQIFTWTPTACLFCNIIIIIINIMIVLSVVHSFIPCVFQHTLVFRSSHERTAVCLCDQLEPFICDLLFFFFYRYFSLSDIKNLRYPELDDLLWKCFRFQHIGHRNDVKEQVKWHSKCPNILGKSSTIDLKASKIRKHCDFLRICFSY